MPVVGIGANYLAKTGAKPLQQVIQQGLGTGAGLLGYHGEGGSTLACHSSWVLWQVLPISPSWQDENSVDSVSVER